jgi:DNA-directed RNA polymerase beta' subunit
MLEDAVIDPGEPPAHVFFVPLDPATLRRRAPGVVRDLVTYNRETLLPARGGLFDEEIFGGGASLEPVGWSEDKTVRRERALRFGRIVLVEGVPHPWQRDLRLMELPVLPADLRPIVRLNGAIVMSDVNVHYREVLVHDGRLRRLQEIKAPSGVVAAERAALARSVACLFDNERQPEPARDDAGRVLVSLRGLLRPDAPTAVATLDEAVRNGADPDAPMPLRLHRIVATLLALGLVARSTARTN